LALNHREQKHHKALPKRRKVEKHYSNLSLQPLLSTST